MRTFAKFLTENAKKIIYAGFFNDGRVVVYIAGKRYEYLTDAIYHDRWKRLSKGIYYQKRPFGVLNEILRQIRAGKASEITNESVSKVHAKTHDIDISQIESIYDKCHIAVEIVRNYDDATNQSHLENINTIANLGSGAYGIYNSSENNRMLTPQLQQRLIISGKLDRRSLNNLPKNLIKQHFPDIDTNQIKEGDTIHVNVKRILSEFKNNEFGAIVEVASTIIHEATHAIERETIGSTTEQSAYGAEHKFKFWVKSNMQKVQNIVKTHLIS